MKILGYMTLLAASFLMSCSGAPDDSGACSAASKTYIEANNKTVMANTLTCAEKNFGKSTAITSCIVTDDPPLSTACAQCFTDAANCTVSNCLSECIGGQASSACQSCVKLKCVPALSTCSGMPASALSPPSD